MDITARVRNTPCSCSLFFDVGSMILLLIFNRHVPCLFESFPLKKLGDSNPLFFILSKYSILRKRLCSAVKKQVSKQELRPHDRSPTHGHVSWQTGKPDPQPRPLEDISPNTLLANQGFFYVLFVALNVPYFLCFKVYICILIDCLTNEHEPHIS